MKEEQDWLRSVLRNVDDGERLFIAYLLAKK